MTLSIAWVRNGNIHLLSDSRISSGNNNVNFAVKISEVYISQLKTTIGLAYAGDTALDQTLRDRLSAVFSIATYNPIKGIARFSDCAHLAAKIHRALAEDFKKAWDVEADFFIAGYDFFQRRNVAYLITHASDFFELPNGVHFIGDQQAVEEAEALLNKDDNPYSLLKKVIENKLVEKVGGAIQCGIIEADGNFRLKGLCIPGAEENKYYFAGAPIEHYEDFIPTTGYLDPFGCVEG